MKRFANIIEDIRNVDKSIFGINHKKEVEDRFSVIEKDNIEAVKEYVLYLEQMGMTQIQERYPNYVKLYKIAAGELNEQEIKDASDVYGDLLENAIGIKSTDNAEIKVRNFPIINTLITSIVNKMDKMHTKVYAKAVNPEATSRFIDEQNKEFRNAVVEEAMKMFEMDMASNNYDEEQKAQKAQAQQKLIQIKEKYLNNFRHEVEVFCNHVLNMEEGKFNMKDIKKEILEKILITNMPFIRVETRDSSYTYNVIKEHDAFFIKSDSDKDASEYSVFGTISYTNFDNIIGKYKLSEENVNKLRGYATSYNKHRPKNRVGDPNDEAYTDITNIMYNLGGYGNFLNDMGNPGNIDSLLKETIINYKMPRKKGELTYIINGEKHTKIVSSAYKIYDKGIYDLTWKKEKTKDNLIDGEHVDWYFEMESWTAIKIDQPFNSSFADKTESVWIRIEKDEVQVKDPYKRYTSILPVHGGQSNSATEKVSLVERGIPYEEIFTFLGNRIEHLAATEIGLFFVLNQAVIPKESFDGSWEESPLLKWSQLAYDLGITLTSTDINQISGQNSLAMGQGYGQVVDLTKTKDIQNKMVLMQTIKKEFYESVGVSIAEISEISPYQTAGSVRQGLQRTNNMIHHFYRRAEEIVRRARQTGVYYMKKFQEDNPRDLSYSVSDKVKHVFRTLGEDFTIADIGVYFYDDITDIEKLQDLQQLVMMDNTMGADIVDKSTVLLAKTTGEVLDKLYSIKADKEQKMEAMKEQEHQRQMEFLKEQEAQLLKVEENKAKIAALDRESDEKIASIRSLGYTNSTGEEIYDLIDRVREDADRDRKHDIELRKIALGEKQIETNNKQTQNTNNEVSKESLELIRLKQREKEINASNERTKALIQLSNKNKK